MENINNIIKKEEELKSIIKQDNDCIAHVEYSTHINGDPHKVIVALYTTNPKTNETFLLKTSLVQNSKELCLDELLDYIKTAMDSFTIIWSRKDNVSIQNTSYFYCYDIQDAINKFFATKRLIDYIIYEVKMNARS